MKNPTRTGLRRARNLSLLAWIGLACVASATPRTYRYFRFTPTQIRSGGLVQLSEFRFFNSGAALPLTGVSVTNPGGLNAPTATEGAMKVIDGDTATKWLDNGLRPLVFDFGSAVTIDAYDYSTANDANARDPISWTLEGSDDNTAWHLLDEIKQAVIPTARFTGVAAHLGGLNLHPIAIPEFKSDFSVVKNGDPVNLSWITRLADGGVTLDPVPGTVAAQDTLSVFPPSDADTTYTLTGTNTVDGSHSASFTVRAVAGDSIIYRYLRFTPTKLRRGNLANSIQLSEFGFLNGITSIPVAAVENPGGNTPTNEGPAKLIDNDVNTKWLDFNKRPVVFDFGPDFSTPITHYYFTTANDSPERDPVRWIIEGSDDNINWTLVDNLNTFDVSIPGNRLSRTQDFPFPGASLPPIATLIGDAPRLVSGEPLVLTWTTNAAVAVEIVDNSGPVGSGLPLSGSLAVHPTADTTYTLTATSAGGITDVRQFSVHVVTSAITRIAYQNFDDAGDEIGLFNAASIVNDFANFPQPGNQKRLRLTPDQGSINGTAWFLKRVDLSQGFRTTFDFQMANLNGGSGADGMSFIIQNDPNGNGITPSVAHESGLPSQALNIKLDAYQNETDPSAAVVQILAGTTPVATANLANFPGLLRGLPNDLTIGSGSIAPYRVRIDYVPGDMDIYFDGVPIISDAPVDLAAPSVGAVDASGKAYVGFSARTGGLAQSHDITRWFLEEGVPSPDLKILGHIIDTSSGQLTLSWASSPNRTYRITRSTDLLDWSNVIQSGIPGDSGSFTAATVSFPPATRQFFRVEEE